ncbi:MAG TPA: DUF2834 domain-containing protein [Myxococcota bacterium]|nr:DUF2834 domain-containing protein [Myxococcota bacterium]
MSLRLLALFVVLGLFGLLTALALREVGYLGIIEPHFQSWGQGQVLADLVIMCALGCIWMLADARARGISPWPFLIVTVFAGSFGPLLYLVTRELRAAATASSRRASPVAH